MSNIVTEKLTPEGFKQWDRDTSVKVGNVWLRIPNEHARLLRKGEPADITYDEWVGRNGKTNYTITAINGQDVKRQQQASGSGLGGQQATGSLAAQQQSKPAAAGGGAYEGAWAGMGPENRARMVADTFVRELYKGTGTHPGKEALATDFQLTYQAWLQGCEGRGYPPAGNVGVSASDNLAEPPDYDGDPGPSGPSDYA